jgi:hypothetical protein
MEKDGNSFFYAQKLDVSDIEDFYSNDGFWRDSYSLARGNAKLDFGNEEYSYYEYEFDENTEKYVQKEKQ